LSAPVLSEAPHAGVLHLQLNRPEARNAINGAVLDELRRRLVACEDRVIVVSSVGGKALSAGGDLGLQPDELARVSDGLFELYGVMIGHPAVIVVAAEGHAVGAGAQLLLASDLRVGSPSLHVRFAGPEHGLAGGMWALPSLVGRGRALDLLLTGRTIDAEEALRIGLVDRVADRPVDAALDLARQVAALEPRVARKIKRLVVAAALSRDVLWAEQAANADVTPIIARRAQQAED
jgi:enoyl-CoA hydratase/carnithine racemase